jgi:hypothetical protein
MLQCRCNDRETGAAYSTAIPGLHAIVCLCVFDCGVCPAGMLGCPESPGYLAAKGKRDEAVKIATKLWGPAGAAQLGTGETA